MSWRPDVDHIRPVAEGGTEHPTTFGRCARVATYAEADANPPGPRDGRLPRRGAHRFVVAARANPGNRLPMARDALKT